MGKKKDPLEGLVPIKKNGKVVGYREEYPDGKEGWMKGMGLNIQAKLKEEEKKKTKLKRIKDVRNT